MFNLGDKKVNYKKVNKECIATILVTATFSVLGMLREIKDEFREIDRKADLEEKTEEVDRDLKEKFKETNKKNDMEEKSEENQEQD